MKGISSRSNKIRYLGVTLFIGACIGLITIPDRDWIGFLAFYVIFICILFCQQALIRSISTFKHRGDTNIKRGSRLATLTNVAFGILGVGLFALCMAVCLSIGWLDHELTVIVICVFFLGIVSGFLMWWKWDDDGTAKSIALALVSILCYFATLYIVSSYAFIEEGSSSKDAMINDLRNIAAGAYQYRLMHKSFKGGERTYIGYKIPTRMASNDNGTYTSIPFPNKIRFKGINAVHAENTMVVEIDSNGNFIEDSWQFTGEFK